MSATFATATAQPLADYYRWQSILYDATRWAFLFGRSRLITKVARMAQPQRILEIGCGTGTNLVRLALAFPKADIVGVDLSPHMLSIAQRKLQRFGQRVHLEQRAYEAPISGSEGYDLIVLSYALSMMNPGYEAVLAGCRDDLSGRGIIAVVDFHDSRWQGFRRWMGINHVRMERHLLTRLSEHFTAQRCEVHRAYAGLWRWMVFVGRVKREGTVKAASLDQA